jgi:polyhydroxybutyrate depolymerase
MRRAVLAGLALLALACRQPASEPRAPSNRFTQAGNHRIELALPGTTRSAIVHLPPDFATRGALPVLLAFHGGGGNAEGFQRYAGLDALADASGTVVIYPDGSGRFARRFLTWNAGGCCGFAQEKRIDDVGFTLALLADLAPDLELDRTRVYATGHSNGAMMAYRLAAEESARIAAIAPVAGADITRSFDPDEPVSVLHVHSVDDPRARFEGGETMNPPLVGGGSVVHRPVEDGLARWRERDGCTGSGTVRETRSDAGHTATLIDFGPCESGSEVALWKLTVAGHAWPGGDSLLPEKLVGPKTQVIRAGDEVFRFIARFAKPDAPPLR